MPILLWSVVVSQLSQPFGRSLIPWTTISGRAASRCGAATRLPAVSAVVTVRLVLSLRSVRSARPALEREQRLRFPDVGSLLCEPRLVLGRRHGDDAADHVGVALATELRALTFVGARRRDPEPRVVRVAWDGVGLAAELRDPLRVVDV